MISDIAVVLPLAILVGGAFVLYLIARLVTSRNEWLALLTATVFAAALGALLALGRAPGSAVPTWGDATATASGIGDVVLREVAKMLIENVREIDFVARYGGEEFALILTETSKDAAIMVAKRIVERVANAKIKAFDENVQITVSIGLASFPENTAKSDMLIEIADKALYQAKSSGRNTVSWF